MPRTFIRHERQRSEHRTRLLQSRFVDPYFYVQGSEPEKMVMAELVRRGIYFEHTPQTNTVGGRVPAKWEADFLLPQYKIWIEVQGAYFHTLPDSIRSDARRFVIISKAGWKVLYWWEWDIRSRLQELFDAVPEFYTVNPAKQNGRRTTEGLPFYEGGTGIDHLAGLRKALQNRARPGQFVVRRRRRRQPK